MKISPYGIELNPEHKWFALRMDEGVIGTSDSKSELLRKVSNNFIAEPKVQRIRAGFYEYNFEGETRISTVWIATKEQAIREGFEVK